MNGARRKFFFPTPPTLNLLLTPYLLKRDIVLINLGEVFSSKHMSGRANWTEQVIHFLPQEDNLLCELAG